MNINFTPALTSTVQGALTSDPLIRRDYSSSPITVGAGYTQLVAVTTRSYSKLEIFDASGFSFEIGIGPAAGEVDSIFGFPGGNGLVDEPIPAGSRIAIKMLGGDATAGELIINGKY